MPKFSIIIPVCGNKKFTDACIETIKQNTSDYELIIVDNGSNPPYQGEGIIHRNTENLGFPAAVNQGIKLARGENIVILNNDTLVTPRWLHYLWQHSGHLDIIGTCTNRASGPQEVQIEPYSDNDRLFKNAYKFHSQNHGQYLLFHRVVFLAVLIKRKVIDKIGFLDEGFSPGNFEDDDYCLRAIQAGFRVGIANDVFIHHEGSATHKSLNLNQKKLLEKNQLYFQKKYPKSRYEILQELNLRNGLTFFKGPQASLALVMIVKNEEKGLENAVLSVQGIVSEVHISVDDSSTDKTLEIARRLTKHVKTFKWTDDFASARNEAQIGVKTDYLMFLDGHEYLKNGDKIADYLKTGADSFLCTVILDNGATIRNPRIYKRGVKFSGKVHELQENIRPKLAIDITIQHDRLTSQDPRAALIRDQQRDDQIPRIMGEQLKQNPKNTRALFHLALHFQTRSQFKEAIKMQNQFLKYAKPHAERWYVNFNKAFCHLALGHKFRAWMSASAADRETPGRWETAKLRAIILIQAHMFRPALVQLVKSFDENKVDVSYKPWKRETNGTWNMMGECFFNLGEFYKASEAFHQAAEMTDDKKFKSFLDRRARLMYDISVGKQK